MRRASRVRRGLAALVVALGAWAAPAAAWAHAALVASSPEEGAVLAEATDGFRLTFNEPVAATSLRLSGAGRTIALEGVAANGAVVTAPAPAGLRRGSYALSYRVVSEDGHPVAGAVTFAIGEPGGGAPDLDPVDPSLEVATWLTRAALSIGVLFGVGGAFARVLLLEGAAGRDAVGALLAVGAIAAPIALGLQGADLIGATAASALAPIAWRAALATTYLWTVAAALAAFGLAGLSLVARGPAAAWLAGLGVLCLGAAFAASGHASAAEPQVAMRAAVFVHAVSTALWIGALAPLGLALRAGGETARRALARFSAAAPVAVGALALAGLAIAARQLESLDALWRTGYGLVLLAKLGLVAGLLALAAANRWRWTDGALAGDAGKARALRRSIAAEIALAAMALCVVALWRFTPPPRSLAEADAQPALAHLETRAAQADVTVTPGRAGASALSMVIMTGDFGPLDAKGVSVSLTNQAAGVGPIRRDATKPGDGTWRIEPLTLPAAGRWTLRIDILVTDYDVERLDGQVVIRP